MAKRKLSASEKEANFAATFHNNFLDSAESRGDREVAWSENERRANPNYIDPRIPEPRIKSGKLFRDIKTKHSWLIRNAKANGRWVRSTASGAIDPEAGSIVSDFLEHSFLNFKLKNEKSLFNGAKKAIKFGDQYWCEQFNEVHQDSQTINLRLDDVFPDYYGDKWIIIRRHITVQQLGEMAILLSRPLENEDGSPQLDGKGRQKFSDGGVARRAFKAVEAVAKSGHFPDRYGWHWTHASKTEDRRSQYVMPAQSEDPQRARAEDDPGLKMVTLLEWHETEHPYAIAKIIPDFSVREGGKFRRRSSLDGAEDLFFQKPTPSQYKACQIVHFSPNAIDDEVFGYGAGEIEGKRVEAADWLLRAGIKLSVRLASPPVIGDDDIRLPRSTLQSPAGKFIPLPSGSRFEYMEPAARTDFALTSMGVLRQLSDEAQGESEQRKGSTGASNTTATASAIAEQGSQSDDLVTATLFFMAIDEIARLKLAILRKHIKKPTLFAQLGTDAPKMLELLPAHLDESIHHLITVGGSLWGTNPTQRVQGLAQMAQTFPLVVDQEEAAEQFARELGYPNPNRFILKPQGPEPEDPNVENNTLALPNGEVEGPSPLEDHGLHIATHQAFMQQAVIPAVNAGQLEPSVLARFNLHVAVHLNLQQQQQAAEQTSAQPGAGPASSPSPTSSAPGPGQLQTTSARNATVDALRQRPNQAANGGAPGGINAPGRQQ